MVILREWRGQADAARAGAYPEHFRRIVLPELSKVAGFLGATLSRRDLGETVEFVVLTRWVSIDAVRRFAGDQLDQAIVEPGAVAALVTFDRTVRHYQLVDEVGPIVAAS